MNRTFLMIAIIGMLAFAEQVSAQDRVQARQTVTFAVMPSPSMAAAEPVKRVTVAPILANSRTPTPVHVLLPRTDVLAETSRVLQTPGPVRNLIVTITD